MKPLNLKHLPKYLKNLRESNSCDENLVVDMGQIVNSSPKFSKLYLGVPVLMLLVALALPAAYYFNDSKSAILVFDTDNKDFSKIISDNGGEVISVKKNENSIYEVKIGKLKDVNSFIERLRKSKEFKKVELLDSTNKQ